MFADFWNQAYPKTYNLEVYLGAGKLLLNAGYLATEVLDIVENGMRCWF